MENPCDITVYVGNPGPASPSVQVQLNGAIIGEYSSLTAVTLSFIGGYNVLELIAADGGLALIGKFLGDLGKAVSLYPVGGDPFSFAGGSGGGLSSTNDIGLGGPGL